MKTSRKPEATGCHLDRMAAGLADPEDILREAQEIDPSLDESFARHKPWDVPDPDTLESGISAIED